MVFLLTHILNLRAYEKPCHWCKFFQEAFKVKPALIQPDTEIYIVFDIYPIPDPNLFFTTRS